MTGKQVFEAGLPTRPLGGYPTAGKRGAGNDGLQELVARSKIMTSATTPLTIGPALPPGCTMSIHLTMRTNSGRWGVRAGSFSNHGRLAKVVPTFRLPDPAHS